MFRVILRLFYNGLKFHGFQRQPNVKTVEGILEETLLRHKCISDKFTYIRYSASGRTDRGVHAISQVIVFDAECEAEKIVEIINRKYSPHIIIWGYRYDNTGEFNARYWAIYREYIYIEKYNDDYDLNSISKACKYLIGLKDFSFLGLPKEVKSQRQLFKIIVDRKSEFLVFKLIAESYARFMIRKLVSLLKLIGEGRIDIDNLEKAITKSNVSLPIRRVKSENLALFNVKYPIHFYTSKDLVNEVIEGTNILSNKSLVFSYISSYPNELLSII